MKRKLPFLFGSMAAMMLSASPVVDRVELGRELPVGRVVSAKVDNAEKQISKRLELKESGKLVSTPEQIKSNPWYADDYGLMPYYISFGNFNCGMDSQYRNLTNKFFLQPAYAPVIYYSIADLMGYTQHEWTYMDPSTLEVATSTDPFIIHEYPEGRMIMPFLTASIDGEYEATYPPFDEEAPQYIGVYGGDFLFNVGEAEPVKFGACNYDIDKEFVYYSSEGVSAFGAGSDPYWEADAETVHGIINLFEEPASPYLLDGLWLNAMNVEASPEATITMTIYKANPDAEYYSEIQGDMIATSTVGVESFEEVSEGYFNIHFPIMTVDEDGFETEGAILISDQILVEISGYNSPEFTSFEPLVQYYDHTSGNNYMLAKFNSIDTGEQTIYSFGMYTSWLVNLSASFPFLATQEDEYTADEEGGDFIVSVAIPSNSMSKSPARASSSIETTSGIIIKEMPEWISYVSDSYNGTTKMYDFVMNAEAMPEEMEGRQENIVFEYNSMEMVVPVSQGQPMSVENAYAKSITSAFMMDDLQLTYPSDVKKLSIYSATGALVKVIDLDPCGSDVVSMPMAKGVYMLSFQGKERVVRKVIK